MSSTDKLEPIPRRELHIFYVLDSSGSMSGAPISALNHAMEESITALSSIAKSSADAEMKIAVLEFNSGCRWITNNGPEKLEDFEWEYIEAGGITDMGAALNELDSKLSRHAFLSSMTGAFFPIIIFVTDGHATDDYKKSLEKIRQNKWFTHAVKIGFAISEDTDLAMLSSVVGNCEAVIKTTDLNLFKRLVKFASVTPSMLQTQSHPTSEEVTGEKIVQEARDQEKLTDDNFVDLKPRDYDPEPKIDPGQESGFDDDDDGTW